ncbi:pyridoxal kinase [Ascoidea rubescens DSM 1968]|uniref:pyridoxal kinase n=1 Tax=Ascoidea rubescens DSM 1968 TaxID=1344418 RepID=A0A1D2VIF5_9ASCO|nr:Ribokinase-like protein [Ascoidea rubescens DSM 1968]ODV61273.1 Ribokinase-like protein [Ascoidea rubescens DSM 1968]
MEAKGNILSIQSHVVHGYVGNKVSTFTLQLKGWNVDSVNTVQFSNHPAYKSFKGFRYPNHEIKDILLQLIDELEFRYDIVLTGYIPSPETLSIIFESMQYRNSLDSNDSNALKWFLDPVMGDNGKPYVDEKILPVYKDILKSGLVYLITPNQFELQLLIDENYSSINNICDYLTKSFKKFHELYPKIDNAIITSIQVKDDNDNIYIAGYSKEKIFYYKIPIIKAIFSGSGDLLSSILLDSYHKYINDDIPLVNALNNTLSIVYKVLELTYNYEIYTNSNKTTKNFDNEIIKVNDLRLIESIKLLNDSENFLFYKPMFINQ